MIDFLAACAVVFAVSGGTVTALAAIERNAQAACEAQRVQIYRDYPPQWRAGWVSWSPCADDAALMTPPMTSRYLAIDEMLRLR